jgi:hypothetical protein
MITSVVMGQGSWTLRFGDSYGRTRITDIVETESGFVAAFTQYNSLATPIKRAFLAHIDQSGALTDTIRIWGEPRASSIWALSLDSLTGQISALGDHRVSFGDESYYWYATDDALQRIDSSSYRCEGLSTIALDNVLRTSTGDLIILGTGTGSSGVWFTALQLIRITQQGDSLDSFLIDNPGFLVGRDIAQIHADTLLVTAYGLPQLPFFQSGIASYAKYTTDLDLVDGFVGRRLDGVDGALTFDNNISDHLHLIQLPSGNLIVSGRTGSASTYRTAIQKITAQGEWLAAFTPQSEFPVDHPAALRSSVLINGNVLLASMENYFVGQLVFTPFLPDIPNRIRIHHLDTALNLKCTHVVDGMSENAYYWLDRIKATSDGGYILCGGRVDLTAPEFLFEGWVQKFGPEDCTIGIPEGPYSAPVRVFPNPGTNGFTLTMNGPDRGAAMDLYDIAGKMVRSASMSFGTLHIDASDLPTGIYMYRLVGRDGSALASGRWVKE